MLRIFGMGQVKDNFRMLSPRSDFRHYLLAMIIVILTSAICFFLTKYIGYQSVSFILLFVVSILSIFMGIGPIALAAALSAFIWNFFFIPPRFTINIDKTEDVMMLCMFFTIALVNGILTSRIRRQEKLAIDKERRARFLDESDKLYKTLFNSISHELRIPVATIMSASESLLTIKHSEAIREELLNEILKASDRLNRLIENLLNMSRLESGHISPRLDWYDIHDLINKVTSGLAGELKPYKLKMTVPDDMPLVRIDFGLMEQVLYNLLLNATLYSGTSSELGINVFYSEGTVTMEVLDRGPGFQPEELALIFNKFYRVEGSKAGGTGLGLSIARGFTEAHKGTLSAENRPGGGAKFIIRIATELPVVEI
jgi:two-component system, OmpR family, sensor histidine kinase KdpD